MAHNTGEVSDKPWSEVNKSELPWECFCPVGDRSKKATWHLPHHEGAGGIDPDTGMYREKGPLNRNGVHASAARFNQTEFDNGADKRTSARHLVDAYRYMEEETPEVLTEAARAELVGADRDPPVHDAPVHDAPVHDPPVQSEAVVARAERGGAPDEAQLAKINALARAELPSDGVYVFPIIISTDQLDSWGTRMHESSLRNFAQDAQHGLPWMNSHRTGGFLSRGELPHGRIFDGEMISDAQGQRVREWVYMQRGIELNGQGNDDLIAAIDGGTVREPSIGFDVRAPLAPDGKYECSICGRNLFDPQCAHIPLMWYAADDTPAQQGAAGAVMAFAWVKNARQVEGSMVWKGATPGAIIEKARAHVAALGAENVKRLELAYGVRLLDPQAGSVKGDLPGEEVIHTASHGTQPAETLQPANTNEEAPPPPRIAPALDDAVASVWEVVDDALADHVDEVGRIAPIAEQLGVLREAAMQSEHEVEQVSRALAEAQARMADLERERDELAERVKQLSPLADDGRAWREDLIKQAVEARVRAQGNAFDADGYRDTLRRADVAYIRSEIAANEKSARALFAPGRPTLPATPTSARPVIKNSSAYQG